ncbi:MAG TPA: hypothetical protein VM325_13445 [Alphaproteobacteria bacterium]|nr:hypothetical protein [Alphaproteobacteria bacterium]
MALMDKRGFIRTATVVMLSTLITVAAGGNANARMQPIHNIVDAPLPARPGVTMRQIERAIISAGSVRGWAVRPVSPGQLIAILNIRRHTAEVTISYTPKRFSITYKTSHNLLYRKSGETEYIHRNYNSWVRFLRNDITRTVGLIGQ